MLQQPTTRAPHQFKKKKIYSSIDNKWLGNACFAVEHKVTGESLFWIILATIVDWLKRSTWRRFYRKNLVCFHLSLLLICRCEYSLMSLTSSHLLTLGTKERMFSYMLPFENKARQGGHKGQTMFGEKSICDSITHYSCCYFAFFVLLLNKYMLTPYLWKKPLESDHDCQFCLPLSPNSLQLPSLMWIRCQIVNCTAFTCDHKNSSHLTQIVASVQTCSWQVRATKWWRGSGWLLPWPQHSEFFLILLRVLHRLVIWLM